MNSHAEGLLSVSRQDSNDNGQLRERLRIWSAPDPLEEASLRQGMAANRKRIAAIDTQNLLLQAQMDALQQQKLELERELAQSQSLFSPIRRLPPDLMVEIFQYLDFGTKLNIRPRSNAEQQHCRALWSRNDATRVSTVCWNWNLLISNVPRFWSSLRLAIDHHCSQITVPHPDLLRTIQCSLRTLLQRSVSAPLTIDIRVDEEWSYLSGMLSPVLREIHRWKKLVLRIPSHYLADAGLRDLGGSLTSLESLEFEFTDARKSNRRNTANTSDWFSNVPRLREVAYDNTRLGIFKLPWAQLKSLSVRNSFHIPSAEDVGILELATSLSRLEFGCSPVETPLECAKAVLPITLLKVDWKEDLDFFENSFELPLLTDLRIRNVWDPVSSFIATIAPTLRRLEMEITDLEPFPWSESFLGSETYFPELTELLVTSWHNMDKDKNSATPADLDLLRVRCPRLTRFECDLRTERPTVSTVQAWAHLLSQIAECPGEGTYTSLKLAMWDSVEKESPLVQLLEDLISRGTAIEISYHSGSMVWRLDASDLECPDLFAERQSLWLEEAFAAYNPPRIGDLIRKLIF